MERHSGCEVTEEEMKDLRGFFLRSFIRHTVREHEPPAGGFCVYCGRGYAVGPHACPAPKCERPVIDSPAVDARIDGGLAMDL